MQTTNNIVLPPVADLTEIAFEDITSEYSWGDYSGFKVIIQRKTRYINATKLCALASTKQGTPKEFRTWQQNKTAQELINEVSADVGIPTSALMNVVRRIEPAVLQGTYVHPDLIPSIAGWACPRFAHKIARIVNAYVIQQYKRELAEKNAIIAKKDSSITEMISTIVEKDSIIADQSSSLVEQKSTIDELRAMLTEIMNNSKATNTTLDATTTKLDATTTKLDALHQESIILTEIARDANAKADTLHNDNVVLTEIAHEANVKADKLTDEVKEVKVSNAVLTDEVYTLHAKIDVIVEDRVPPPNRPADTEVVYIFARVRQPTDPVLQMQMTRVKKQGLAKAIARLRSDGYIIEVGRVSPTPNAVAIGTELFNRLRAETYKPTRRVIAVNRQSFSLRATGADIWGIKQIAELLATIDAEKRNV